MKKTFVVTQEVLIIHETSIIVEGVDEQDCMNKIKNFTDNITNEFITNDTPTPDDIEIINVGFDYDSVGGTKRIYVTDEQSDYVHDTL